MDSTGDLGPDSAAGPDDADLPAGLPPTADAAAAARRLAATLTAHAEDLSSDDLATVSAAMAAVRSGARAVEAALTARGWGGGVLHGFGSEDEADPWDAGLAALLDEADESDLDDLDLDGPDGLGGPDDADDDPWEVPAGTKLTYQARWDFVVTDPEALLRHVERRAAELGQPWDRAAILEHHPLFVLTELESFTARDLDGAGLVFAGGQNVVHEIPLTLWELDDDARDDEFPTATA